ncbi:MAG: hypothetical protein Q4G29_02715 [Pseudoscardovia radai]|nr:hypothetical protein [Pseudoscardovia radai]
MAEGNETTSEPIPEGAGMPGAAGAPSPDPEAWRAVFENDYSEQSSAPNPDSRNAAYAAPDYGAPGYAPAEGAAPSNSAPLNSAPAYGAAPAYSAPAYVAPGYSAPMANSHGAGNAFPNPVQIPGIAPEQLLRLDYFDENDLPVRFRPLTVSEYVGFLLLFSLPIVGLVATTFYSTSSAESVNLRNFSRAMLILHIAVDALVVIIVLLARFM